LKYWPYITITNCNEKFHRKPTAATGLVKDRQEITRTKQVSCYFWQVEFAQRIGNMLSLARGPRTQQNITNFM
jgi:hypothetical protein